MYGTPVHRHLHLMHMSYSIVICNQKGGVGKTTTAVNISASLSLNHKTLLADLDLQANAGSSVGIPPQPFARSVFNPNLEKSDIKATDIGSLHVAPSTFDKNLSAIDHRNISENLQDLSSDYSFLVIDSPPSLEQGTLSGIFLADLAVIPVQCQYLSLEGVTQIVTMIRSLKPEGLDVKILPTMLNVQNQLEVEVFDEVCEYFKEDVLLPGIPFDTVLAEAPSHGKCIIDYDVSTPGSIAYLSVTQEVIANGKKIRPWS